MRKVLTLACCVGVASLVGAAPRDEEDAQYKKKGGGGSSPQQQVGTAHPVGGAKKLNAGPGGGPHRGNVQNFQQPSTTTGNYNALKQNKKGKWQGPVTGETGAATNLNSSRSNRTYAPGDAHFGKGKHKVGGNLDAQDRKSVV